MKKILLLLLFTSLISCEDGDIGEEGAQGTQGVQGTQGEQGVEGEQGLPAPIPSSDLLDFTDFALFTEDFENGNSLNINQLSTGTSAWSTGVFNLSAGEFVIDSNRIIEINNSNLNDQILEFNDFNGINVASGLLELQQSTIFFSGDVPEGGSTSVGITFNNVEPNSVLLFDAYISSERTWDFLNWSINGQFVNGISGSSTNADGEEVYQGPFKVAIELEEGTNNLILTYIKDPVITAGLDSGAIDNIQILDLESYLDALDDDNNERNLISSKSLDNSKLNNSVVLYSDKLTERK